MNTMYREKSKENKGLLSATRPKGTVLNTRLNQTTQLQTRLKQKKKIVVYIEAQQYFIEHAAAYALGFASTRSIMLDKPKLVPISYDLHNKLRSNDEFEIEYVNLEHKKEKLRVFVDGNEHCIENGAAYALGLLTVEEFNNTEDKYYYITGEILRTLKNKYDVEMYSINLSEETNQRYK